MKYRFLGSWLLTRDTPSQCQLLLIWVMSERYIKAPRDNQQLTVSTRVRHHPGHVFGKDLTSYIIHSCDREAKCVTPATDGNHDFGLLWKLSSNVFNCGE